MVPLIYFLAACTLVAGVNVAVTVPSTDLTVYFDFVVTVTLTNADTTAYTTSDDITLSTDLGSISGITSDSGVSNSVRTYTVYIDTIGSATITATLTSTSDAGNVVADIKEEK